MTMKAAKSILRRDAGIALLTTLLLLVLMSSLLVGFILLVIGGTKLSGMNDDYSKAYYGAEAGMEKMTADLGTLFDQNYSPSGAQVQALATVPPNLNGIQFIDAKTGGSGYTIACPPALDGSGNCQTSNAQVKSGPYQGMIALSTPYTLTITSHTNPGGSEVKLQRTTQTVGIPMFQFGVFSDSDLSFFPGPPFNFGGRTHTNGNLFLASGNSVTLGDRVTAVGDVIRTNLSNGFPTASNYGGSVNIATSSGSPPPTRALAPSEGSLTGTIGSGANPIWQNISMGAANYNGYLRGGTTAPSAKLNLGVVTLGSGITQSVDIIRRPPGPENLSVTAERYFAQASMKILLSDNPTDIMNLPCIDPTTQPFNLADLAQLPASWTAASANAAALFTAMNTNNAAGLSTTPVPLAASGAPLANASYNPTNLAAGDPQGYWIPKGNPIIKGYIKIEIQKGYANPCGQWKDVTIEVLSLGYAGKNINPTSIIPANGGTLPGNIPVIQNNNNGATVGQRSQLTPPVGNAAFSGTFTPLTCSDVHPNAIIRLERVRDNPSNATLNGTCGVVVNAGKVTVAPGLVTDYWPNVLFDTREGTLRDTVPSNTAGVGNIKYNQMVELGGVMHYIEVDAANVAKYFSGALGSSGILAFDPNVAPNDFTVYVSDRRDNYTASQSWVGSWPPLSPSFHETGEFGFTDVVNANSSPTGGCPNGSLDTGEDLDGTGNIYLYGGNTAQTRLAWSKANPWTGGYGFFPNLNGTALTANPVCSAPVTAAAIWPGNFVVNSNEARQNPNLFFRRAIKIVNGSFLNLGNCPGSTSAAAIPCGLTIATENSAYIQGDFNSNSQGNGWNDPHVATSVAADAVTFLSDNWNDYNSFLFPYTHAPVSGSPAPVSNNPGQRAGYTTFYRVAIASGKGISFPQPGGTGNDFGTDGGVHNFLRYIEDWSNQTLNYKGSIINLFFNRQAVGTFKCCTTVYNPPGRGYLFDVEFLDPQLLPPRTPLFRDVNTTGFTQLLLPGQ
jgi:hypothetical protein